MWHLISYSTSITTTSEVFRFRNHVDRMTAVIEIEKKYKNTQITFKRKVLLICKKLRVCSELYSSINPNNWDPRNIPIFCADPAIPDAIPRSFSCTVDGNNDQHVTYHTELFS